MSNNDPIMYTVAAIYTNNRNDVLMMLRDDMPAWCLIGGVLDDGEDYLQALARETLEETGLDIGTLPSPELFGDFEKFDTSRQEVTMFNRIYRLNIGDAKVVLQHEGCALRFFPIDALPNNIFGIQHDIIQNYLNNTQNQGITRIPRTHFNQHFADIPAHDLTGFDIWQTHPKVVAKRQAGKLRYDPLPQTV